MAWWKLVVISAVLVAGNTNALRFRILNGEDAKIEDFPYQASFRLGDQHQCGGSIISERHILTAAHCITSDTLPPYDKNNVLTGTSNIRTGGKMHKIANITVHPDVKCVQESCTSDIAIITLKDVIVFDEHQQKINLPQKNHKAGQKATLTGWGLSVGTVGPEFPDNLQKFETSLISMEECQEKVIDSKTAKILDTEVCTLSPIPGNGACYGDSGSPLVVNGELVGIVSWFSGKSCADGHPVVYTNVYKFIDFIKSVMNQTM